MLSLRCRVNLAAVVSPCSLGCFSFFLSFSGVVVVVPFLLLSFVGATGWAHAPGRVGQFVDVRRFLQACRKVLRREDQHGEVLGDLVWLGQCNCVMSTAKEPERQEEANKQPNKQANNQTTRPSNESKPKPDAIEECPGSSRVSRTGGPYPFSFRILLPCIRFRWVAALCKANPNGIQVASCVVLLCP